MYENPSIWGGSTWKLLHCISMTYPKNPTQTEKKRYKGFLNQMRHVLPCIICRRSYSVWIKTNPPDLESRTKFVNWVIDLHNYVNQRLGKPVLKKREAIREIQKFCKN